MAGKTHEPPCLKSNSITIEGTMYVDDWTVCSGHKLSVGTIFLDTDGLGDHFLNIDGLGRY